jgi:hypothetical protein
MVQAHQNTARVVETAAYEKPQRRESIIAANETPVRIPSPQQLRKVFATSVLHSLISSSIG